MREIFIAIVSKHVRNQLEPIRFHMENGRELAKFLKAHSNCQKKQRTGVIRFNGTYRQVSWECPIKIRSKGINNRNSCGNTNTERKK